MTKPRVVTADELARVAASQLSIAASQAGRYWSVNAAGSRVVIRVTHGDARWLIDLINEHAPRFGGDAA